MRNWQIVFRDGENLIVRAPGLDRARTFARIHNGRGISIIRLIESPAQQRAARRQAVVLAKQLGWVRQPLTV